MKPLVEWNELDCLRYLAFPHISGSKPISQYNELDCLYVIAAYLGAQTNREKDNELSLLRKIAVYR